MIHPKRIQQLTIQDTKEGPIIYWMTREHRVHDNWGLLFAQEMAKKQKQPLIVLFCLRQDLKQFSGTRRWVDFMLKGLQEVEKTLATYHIPFVFLFGDPITEIPHFIKNTKSAALITDFYPLHIYEHWQTTLTQSLQIPLFVVDSHNIVPCLDASPKAEFGAYTIRPKIQKKLHEFLDPFPILEKQEETHAMQKPDWSVIEKTIIVDESIKPVSWIKPGEKAAQKQLETFVTSKLDSYAEKRNDPTIDAQSNLSPYLHFGHISAQTIVKTIHSKNLTGTSVDAFLEELIIRKELSDNFCYYTKNYTSVDSFPSWAKKTLGEHLPDPREFIYTKEAFEGAKTHDTLWNAAQMEMLTKGKMHGYMRMYWAKKIFEWSADPQTAMNIAISLNDRYFLDGRDPNGYTGICWSIGGVHDRAWFERPIFGKIRYMNANGAKTKFNVSTYINQHKNASTV